MNPAERSVLQRITHVMRALSTDPVVTLRALPGEYRQKRGRERYAESDLDDAWFQHLHNLIGAPWPCPQAQLLETLMADIGATLAANGLDSGRHTYGWYSDAEIALCSAMWCVVFHNQPEVVIETGVAHGVSSRVVLEALGRNERGHLWSIDLPHPLEKQLRAQTAVAVTDGCRPRWSYLEGSSRQRLPALVSDVDTVDLFIHDSLHTARNTLFEMEQAAVKMPTGGVMLIDDIRAHAGFATFAGRHEDYRTLVCQTPDKVGMFGIAVKVSA